MKENLKKLFAVVLAVAMLAAQVVVPTNAATNYYCSVCGEDAELSATATVVQVTWFSRLLMWKFV